MSIPFFDRIKLMFAPESGDDATNKQYVDGVAATKANASHQHLIGDVTNLQTALDGKAASSHTHTASQITDFATAVTASGGAVESTWLYPNGGTAATPGNITTNQRFTLASPWPGYKVKCIVEVLSSGAWGMAGWCSWYNGGMYAVGVSATQSGDTIIVQSGNYGVCNAGNISGGSFTSSFAGPVPCRVYCEKGGSLP